jgi:hypothetical protein
MKFMMVVALACVLCSCMTTEQREAQNDKHCSEIAPRQSHDYTVCRTLRDQEYEANRRATGRALMAVGSGMIAAGAASPAAEPPQPPGASQSDLLCERSGPGQMICH